MDIEDIEELANRLIEAGLDEETVESILNDLVEIDDETQTEQFHYDETINPEIFTRISNRLIIDSVYSGKTLLNAKALVEKEGGIPTLLGVYPKSKSVLNILD